MENARQFSVIDAIARLCRRSATMKCRSTVYIGLEILMFLFNITLLVQISVLRTPGDLECIDATSAEILTSPTDGRVPIVWLPKTVTNKATDEPDKSMLAALSRKGYIARLYDGKVHHTQWDVIYTTMNPYAGTIGRLTNNSKICHVPGIVNITNSLQFLIQSRQFDFSLQPYVLPREAKKLQLQIDDDPDKYWTVTSLSDNKLKVIQAKDIDIDNDEDQFVVRRFTENPYLISNQKFTIDAYVLITSVDPLRIYIYEDLNLQFSVKDYDPNDLGDQRWFFSGHLNKDRFWQMEDFQTLNDDDSLYVTSQRKILERHIRTHTGKDSSMIFQEIQRVVDELFYHSERHLRRTLDSIKNLHNSNIYELTKWRFVMDDQGKLYLLDISTNPALDKPYVRPDDEIDFVTQMSNAALSVVGIPANYIRKGYDNVTAEMKTSIRESDLFVYQDVCYTESCIACGRGCDLCPLCLSQENNNMLKATYREQLQRLQFRLAVPNIQANALKPTKTNVLEERLQSRKKLLMTKWRHLKCTNDLFWCS